MNTKQRIEEKIRSLNITRDTTYLSCCTVLPYADIFDGLHNTWLITHPDAVMDLDIASYYAGHAINFYLYEEDSMSGFAVQSLFDYLERQGIKQTYKSNVEEHTVWIVHYAIDNLAFTMRLYYGASKFCKTVETGEMIPETRVECE